MFGFFKQRPVPALLKSNRGIGTKAKLDLTNGQRSWTEEFDLVQILASTLKQRGRSVKNEKSWIEDRKSGFMLSPQLVDMRLLNDGGIQTLSTIQINHSLLVPDGTFEFQHSTGNSATQSLANGFDMWAQTDFVALLDALEEKPSQCTVMVMQFPATEGRAGRVRRAILGPTAHYMQEPPPKTDSEEHPFCPCCLLTRSGHVFRELIQADGFQCIRMFAARDVEGNAQADCRVNGEEFPQGAQALREYAATWPLAGYEFRKQYVVLQNRATATVAAETH
jgi:hypothetical protein